MNAIEILVRAVEYDAQGRRLEALNLYEDGICELLKSCKNETDKVKRDHYRSKITGYMDRAEKIKQEIQRHKTLGEVIDRIVLVDGVTGYDYGTIFGKYLNDSIHEVEIEEPYLKENYQIFNLVRFLELALRHCRNLKYVKVTTIQDTRTNSEQSKGLESLQQDLRKRSIQLSVQYRPGMHDRQVILSNGYIFKIGRGLHIFKPANGKYVIGSQDSFFRECRDTSIDIFKCKENV